MSEACSDNKECRLRAAGSFIRWAEGGLKYEMNQAVLHWIIKLPVTSIHLEKTNRL